MIYLLLSALLGEVFCAHFLATSQLNCFQKELGAVLQSHYIREMLPSEFEVLNQVSQ